VLLSDRPRIWRIRRILADFLFIRVNPPNPPYPRSIPSAAAKNPLLPRIRCSVAV
jgi:hypothetical protein